MSIGGLLPAALSAWMPRRAVRAVSTRTDHLPLRAVRSTADAVPRGMIAIAPETHTALAATIGFARSRSVDLQMAADPSLVAQVDAQGYQTCLRQLIQQAVGRASSGVLVTAMRQADGVEIAVLDDGAGVQGPMATHPPLPPGCTLTADYQPDRGTTILLRLPLPDGPADWLPAPRNAEAAHGQAASAAT